MNGTPTRFTIFASYRVESSIVLPVLFPRLIEGPIWITSKLCVFAAVPDSQNRPIRIYLHSIAPPLLPTMKISKIFCSISFIWAAESYIQYPSDDGSRDNGYYSIPVPETFKLVRRQLFPNYHISMVSGRYNSTTKYIRI